MVSSMISMGKPAGKMARNAKKRNAMEGTGQLFLAMAITVFNAALAPVMRVYSVLSFQINHMSTRVGRDKD